MSKSDDVAAYILARMGEMTATKLQKLLYYAQAWHMVWSDGAPLFDDEIQAWANGPVVRSVYAKHRLQFTVTDWPYGDASQLSPEERENIDIVLKFYGDRPGHELSELTHREDPWLRTRDGLAPGERSMREISRQSIYEYYDGLTGTAD